MCGVEILSQNTLIEHSHILLLCIVLIEQSDIGYIGAMISIVGEMHGIVGRAWTFTCNNNYKHNTLYVLSVQATVQLHE